MNKSDNLFSVQTQAMLSVITQILTDGLAKDVSVIDAHRNSSGLFDAVVIATVDNSRHAQALSNKMIGALKDAKFGKVRVEGNSQSDWLLVDAGSCLIHLFRSEARQLYDLESLFQHDIGHLEQK